MDTQELLKTPKWMASNMPGVSGLSKAARALDDSEEDVPFAGFSTQNAGGVLPSFIMYLQLRGLEWMLIIMMLYVFHVLNTELPSGRGN